MSTDEAAEEGELRSPTIQDGLEFVTDEAEEEAVSPPAIVESIASSRCSNHQLHARLLPILTTAGHTQGIQPASS